MLKKKQIGALSLASVMLVSLMAGCGGKSDEAAYLTPDDFEPEYYTSEGDVPDGTYCIVHEEEDGSLRYYPLYAAENTMESINESATGSDPTRLWWVNYNVDEGLVPTLYAESGDYLIYKSYSAMELTFSLEKFFDDGYTIGICGLTEDTSGHYQYDMENGGYVLTTSDAYELDTLDIDNIFLAYINGEKVTSSIISESGTVLGLDLMETYECDVRLGTESVLAEFTANAHYFTSAETYILGEFEFISEYVARIDMPEYALTGYYGLNGAGYFRYLADGDDYHSFSASDYNDTSYIYNEDGKILGTDGYVLDEETGFLVAGEIESEEETEVEYTPDYSYMEDASEIKEALDTELIEETEETETTEVTER